MPEKNIYMGSYWRADADKSYIGTGNLRIAELMKAVESLEKGETDVPFIIFTNDKGDNPRRPDYNIVLRRPMEQTGEHNFDPDEPSQPPVPSDFDDVPF